MARTSKATPQKLEEIRGLLASGTSIRQIATVVGLSRATIRSWIDRHGLAAAEQQRAPAQTMPLPGEHASLAVLRRWVDESLPLVGGAVSAASFARVGVHLVELESQRVLAARQDDPRPDEPVLAKSPDLVDRIRVALETGMLPPRRDGQHAASKPAEPAEPPELIGMRERLRCLRERIGALAIDVAQGRVVAGDLVHLDRLAAKLQTAIAALAPRTAVSPNDLPVVQTHAPILATRLKGMNR